LARQRLQYHGFVNAEFYALSIADLPTLGMKFDYINCDEVLYLLPNRDPAIALSVFKAVLKPHGIIRANLHSSLQRAPVYRSQEIFRMMGFFDHNPTELEVGLVVETMQALKDQVDCKIRTWNPKLDNEEPQERILANHLLQGDKGFTIPDLFAALDTADLEFISMVNWRGWELRDLFKDPHQLPAFLEISLPNTSIAEQLHLFELFHPVHRLLDFWCTHPGQPETHTPLAEWQLSDWQTAHIHLHPQLQTSAIRQDLVNCIAHHQPFEISRYITLPTTSAIVVDNPISACLLPLWEHPQPFNQLVERWLRIQPCDPVTLEPVNPQAALADIKHLLQTLEAFLYVMVGQIH
jgi:SAM-dependent methyltransferase